MTKPKSKDDVVKMAKNISKVTQVPLPKVAAVMQKYPLDKVGMGKAYDECLRLGTEEMKKGLKECFPTSY